MVPSLSQHGSKPETPVGVILTSLSPPPLPSPSLSPPPALCLTRTCGLDFFTNPVFFRPPRDRQDDTPAPVAPRAGGKTDAVGQKPAAAEVKGAEKQEEVVDEEEGLVKPEDVRGVLFWRGRGTRGGECFPRASGAHLRFFVLIFVIDFCCIVWLLFSFSTEELL